MRLRPGLLAASLTLFLLPAIYAIFVEHLGMTIKADKATDS